MILKQEIVQALQLRFLDVLMNIPILELILIAFGVNECLFDRLDNKVKGDGLVAKLIEAAVAVQKL